MEDCQMKTPTATEITMSALNSANSTAPRQFAGTSNPRQLRAIHGLLQRPISRHDLDGLAGVTNAPELVAQLRRRGLELPCERIDFTDRDGIKCRPGVYRLSEADRRAITSWLHQHGQKEQRQP